MKTLFVALVLAAVALPAPAQTQVRRAQVYRCGPDGRDLRDSPCPGGTAASNAVDYDQPSSADGKAARDRHLADARQADALAAARRASEAEARRVPGQHARLQAPPPSPPPTASAPQVVHLKPPKLAKPRKPAASASSAGR